MTADGVWSMALTGSLGTLPATLKLSSAAATAKGDKTAADGSVAISATLADNDFDGSLRPASQARRAMLSGKLMLGSLALDRIAFGNAGGSAGVASQPAASPAAKGSGKAQPPAWRDKPLPIAALNRLDADLTVSAKALSWRRISVEKPRARVLLRNGRLQYEQVTAALPGLSLTGDASVDAGARPPAVTLALRTDRVDLSRAQKMLANPPRLDGTIDALTVTLQTHGDTPTALIRGLGGKVAATSVQLHMPAGKGRERREVGLSRPNLSIEPSKTVSLSSGVTLATRSFDLTLTGGSLADLLWQAKPWPRIAVSARGKLGDEDVAVKGHVGPLSAVVAGRDVTLDLALSDLPAQARQGTLAARQAPVRECRRHPGPSRRPGRQPAAVASVGSEPGDAIAIVAGGTARATVHRGGTAGGPSAAIWICWTSKRRAETATSPVSCASSSVYSPASTRC